MADRPFDLVDRRIAAFLEDMHLPQLRHTRVSYMLPNCMVESADAILATQNGR